MKIDEIFDIPFIVFIASLIAFSVFVGHSIDNIARKTSAVQKEVKSLRHEHLTRKSELMQKTKRTTIEKQLEKRNIQIPSKAPTRLNPKK